MTRWRQTPLSVANAHNAICSCTCVRSAGDLPMMELFVEQDVEVSRLCIQPPIQAKHPVILHQCSTSLLDRFSIMHFRLIGGVVATISHRPTSRGFDAKDLGT